MKKKIYAIFLVVLFSGCLSNTSTWDRVDADTSWKPIYWDTA